MSEKSYKTVQPIRKAKDREAMASYLLQQSLRNYTLFEFNIRVGRRVSDLCALNVDDVAYLDERGRLVVAERLIITEAKTGKFTSVLINERAQRVIGKYLQQRLTLTPIPQQLLAQPLFRSRQRNRQGEYRLSDVQVWRILHDAAQACGVPGPIGTHSLRKTCGYLLYQRGTSLALIQKFFNHSSPDITLAYIGITQDDMDKALREIG